MITGTNQLIRRANTIHALLLVFSFNQSILQRVEGNHRNATTRTYPIDRTLQAFFQRIQLIIDRNTQGLKCLSSWMDLSSAPLYHSGNEFRQLMRRP
jgi:hypothetical protein